MQEYAVVRNCGPILQAWDHIGICDVDGGRDGPNSKLPFTTSCYLRLFHVQLLYDFVFGVDV